MTWTLLFIVAGLAGLVVASDRAVDAARELAEDLGVPTLIIGLTITSIGTSLPELATNIAAGFSTLSGTDASGIAVGNVVGSNLSQITLLLGLTGWIATLTIPKLALRRDGTMVAVALALMAVTCADGRVTRSEGGALVAAYGLYLLTVLIWERRRQAEDPSPRLRDASRLRKNLVVIGVALLVVVLSAHLLTSRSVALARHLGWSETVIGLFVGIGTGLPELTVSLRAIRRHDGELSLGNLLGSNITDPLLSFGAGALVAPVAVARETLAFDLPSWAAATAIALLLLSNHQDLNRRESSVLLVVFLWVMVMRMTVVG